jgi:hypothetical protein
MSDAPADNAKPPRFPLLTAAASLVLLFLFLGLMWSAGRVQNPLAPKADPADAKGEPKLDAGAKLDEIGKRNREALDGVGAKMSRGDAHDKLLKTLKGPNDTLPFPAPEPQK